MTDDRSIKEVVVNTAVTNRSANSVAILGCGYVGYPLALVAASAGYAVTAIDIDSDVVDRVNAGDVLIDEPGLDALTVTVREMNTLVASTEIPAADIYVIAVPTPVEADGKTPNTSMVAAAAASIASVIEPGAVVIVESTVPPGTCRNVVVAQLEHSGLRIGTEILLAHCPERVHPGDILDELIDGDRIIGGLNQESTDAATEFYRTFVKGALVETDITTAEFCKLMENTFRDVNIALANQIAELAEIHDVDAHEAVRIANHHPRVEYLTPGIGVGGHCIPVDPWFLLAGDEVGDVVRAARTVNDRQPKRIADRIRSAISDIESPRLLLIGAAYKPEVDDTRNSPALLVRDHLEEQGILVDVHDPLVDKYANDLIESATGVDAVVLLVPHQRVVEELAARSTDLVQVMRHPILLDVSAGTVGRTEMTPPAR